MFTQKKYDLNGFILEQEYHYAGEFGRKGEKRAKKKKLTPEQMDKQNQFNKTIKTRRLMRANFGAGDIFCTLKYKQGIRRTAEQLKEDWKKFYAEATKYYKKLGEPFRWIQRMEIGERGGAHIHILLNRIPGEDTDIVIQAIWNKITGGRVNFQPAYIEGGFEQLAAYMTKKPTKEKYPAEYRQLSLLPQEERKVFQKISSSRNLLRPQPEVKKFSHWTMRKILKDGIENIKPTPGYYIDRNSIVCGKNPYTGMTYLYYTEYSLFRGKWERTRINTEAERHFG